MIQSVRAPGALMESQDMCTDKHFPRVVTGNECADAIFSARGVDGDSRLALRLYPWEVDGAAEYERLLQRYAFAVRGDAIRAGKAVGGRNLERWSSEFLGTAVRRSEVPSLVLNYFRKRWGVYGIRYFANYQMGVVVIWGLIYVFIPTAIAEVVPNDSDNLLRFLARFDEMGLGSTQGDGTGSTIVVGGDELLRPLVKLYSSNPVTIN